MHAREHIDKDAGPGNDLAAPETPDARPAGKKFIVKHDAAAEMNAAAGRYRRLADAGPAI
ncbi:hypothetical protein GGI59_006098 [Rhizobium lentis]|uniref:Uncharacterized protein n=1 Tax=Rhizobium lentis TaxID=1138194 RepID=A0A7W9CYF3_9HYPH|nr:hypothetical protein [Rhizobium lentis]MBB5553829.1 hypothetical protein [Rhizobium lentis]MBB5564390.1 hypothetical protein [Rhizobium lentis]MBB5564956.1 hypothetical protein [Rhizobium lentis]